jgi:cytochrome c-type biogenesis protein CcmF
VGPPYFAVTFAPIFVALLLLLPFGPRLSWRRGDLALAARQLAPGLGVALVAGVVAFAAGAPSSLAAACAFALAGWVIAACVLDMREKLKTGALPVSSLASVFAHAGLGLSLLGIAGTSLWKSEALEIVAPGRSVTIASYTLVFDGVAPFMGPNYTAARATIEVRDRGKFVAMLYPETRSYPAEGQAVTKTAIHTTGFSDLYVALGDDRGGGRYVIRAYVNPLAPFIWFGGAVMALGGLASLVGRLRLRVVRLAPAE